MKILRIVLMISALIIIIAQIILLDYTNLNWSQNRGSYLSIIAMMLIILSLILSNRQAKSKQA